MPNRPRRTSTLLLDAQWGVCEDNQQFGITLDIIPEIDRKPQITRPQSCRFVGLISCQRGNFALWPPRAVLPRPGWPADLPINYSEKQKEK